MKAEMKETSKQSRNTDLCKLMEFICRHTALDHDTDQTFECTRTNQSFLKLDPAGNICLNKSNQPMVSISDVCRHSFLCMRPSFVDLKKVLDSCSIKSFNLQTRLNSIHSDVHYNDDEATRTFHLTDDATATAFGSVAVTYFGMKVHYHTQ